MNDVKISSKLQAVIDSAVCKVVRRGCEMQQLFRLDVRVDTVPILVQKPCCITLRLVCTNEEERGKTRFTLRDNKNRFHCLSVMVMEDLNKDEAIYVMFNSEYARSTRLVNSNDLIHFSAVEQITKEKLENGINIFDCIGGQITDFLSRGLIKGQPYPGYVPA